MVVVQVHGFITNNCGILTLLEKDDVCLADKGFPGVKCEDAIIVMPPFVHDGRLTEEEVEKNLQCCKCKNTC
jgi:hypothetical protein